MSASLSTAGTNGAVATAAATPATATAAPRAITGADRFRAALAHRELDRIPIHDSPWAATIDRWKSEGYPHHVPADEYFGYELCGFGADLSPRFPVRVLSRNAEY